MTTSNIGLNVPSYKTKRWDLLLNANTEILDTMLGQIVSIDVSALTSLTAAQLQYQGVLLTGTLSGNKVLNLPSLANSRQIKFYNGVTLGGYTLTLAGATRGTYLLTASANWEELLCSDTAISRIRKVVPTMEYTAGVIPDCQAVWKTVAFSEQKTLVDSASLTIADIFKTINITAATVKTITLPQTSTLTLGSSFRIWNNGTVTLSFKAYINGASLTNVKAAVVSWSGTLDAVTSDIVASWNAADTNPTLIANCTYENTPVNLNLVNGWNARSITATIDTASTKNLIVFIWSDVTTTTVGHMLYITDVQLEKGPIATNFERLPIQQQLANCQRYYEKSYNFNTAVGASGTPTLYWVRRLVYDSSAGAKNLLPGVKFAVSKRAAPTITAFKGDGTINSIDSGTGAQAVNSIVDIGENGFNRIYCGSGDGGDTWYAYNWVAEIEM